MRARVRLAILGALALLASTGLSASAAGAAPEENGASSFLGQLHKMSQVASTIPPNGDVNPYGVAVVPATVGRLTQGDTLVSNFNDKANIQGTGTTIMEVSPTGKAKVFADISKLPASEPCPAGIGLTTALGILPGGWVVVGSLPTHKGGVLPGENPAGCLVVLNSHGTPVETFTNHDLVGPRDLAVHSDATSAELFVSNALGGDTRTNHGIPVAGLCRIVRLDLALRQGSPPKLASTTVIGKDFPWMANAAALILAPTGLALASDGTLYVDDSETNTISAIPHALTRLTALTASDTTISSGGALNAPLGMMIAPNGHLIVVNGNNGKAVEVTAAGKQIATKTLLENGAGDLFGLAVTSPGNGLLAVNDGTNALDLYTR